MIPNITTNTVEKSADFQNKVGGIAKGSEAYVFSILRDSLYSNKIQSLLREYLVNALDEHVKHNVQRPIRVTFPNSLQPTFKVRDFGAGLDKAGVFKYFADYGASDKRESNEVVGFYGIGSKSAFCYTESFEIISYQNGKKFSFIHVINEKGLNELNFIGSENTTEPNGVEIIIPVQNWDTNEFVNEGKKLIRWFKTFPEILGLAEEWNITELKPEPLLQGSCWKLLPNLSQPHAIMGEVAYPINVYSISNLENWERNLLNGNVMLYFNIGDLQVTASREELQFTEQTTSKIREVLAVIKAEITELLQERFNNAKNLVEAKSLYWDMFMTGNLKDIFRELSPTVLWNGEEITNNEIKLYNPATFGNQSIGQILTYEKKHKGKRYSNQYRVISGNSDRLLCRGNLELYLDDTDGKKNNYKRRAVTLIEQGSEQVQVLQVRDAKAFANLGLDVTTLPSYKEVTPAVVSSNRVAGLGTDEAKKKKHLRKEFRFNRNSYSTYASDYWEVSEVSDQGLFISIDRFKPDTKFAYEGSKGANTVHKLRDFLTNLESFGIVIPEIYGVKKGEVNTFDDWVIDQLRSLDKSKISLYKEFREGDFDKIDLDSEKFLPESPLRQYIELRNNILNQSTLLNLLESNSIEIPVSTRLTELKAECEERYPMLFYCIENCYSLAEDDRIISYIKRQDEQEQTKQNYLEAAASA